MPKTLALVLLAAASCFGQSGRNAVSINRGTGTPTVPFFPRVVAQVALTGQTMPIPTTTLFTPKKNGLFRISTYAAMTTPDVGNGARWTVSYGWSDDVGAEGPAQVLALPVGSVPPTAFGECGPVNTACPLLVEDIAGVPLTYSVGYFAGNYGGTYELFIIVEQLM